MTGQLVALLEIGVYVGGGYRFYELTFGNNIASYNYPRSHSSMLEVVSRRYSCDVYMESGFGCRRYCLYAVCSVESGL